MILSDGDIRRRLTEGGLVVEPLDDPELQIQPASIDLRLGREFLEFQRTNIPCIHPESEQEVAEYVDETHIDANEEFILHPGDFVLGTTKERVEIPPDLIAHVEGRSSLGRLAVVVHASLPYDEDVFLWTPTEGFGFYEIGDIVENERSARAVAFDPQTLRVSTHRVTDYITNPRKRIYRVTLESGRDVRVTQDHNLFTLDAAGGVSRLPSKDAEGAWVMVPGTIPDSPTESAELDLTTVCTETDKLVTYAADGGGGIKTAKADSNEEYAPDETRPLEADNPPDTAMPVDGELACIQDEPRLSRWFHVTPEIGWILGCYISDGTVDNERILFHDRTDDEFARIATWFESCEETVRVSRQSPENTLTVVSPLWAEIFDGLAGTEPHQTIPTEAWNWPSVILRELLEGLLDECTESNGIHQVLASGDASFASQLMYLATTNGFHSSIDTEDQSNTNGTLRSTCGSRQTTITVTLDGQMRRQYVPTPSRLLRHYRELAGLSTTEMAAEITQSADISITAVETGELDVLSRELLCRFRDVYESAGVDPTRLNQILRDDIRFEKVVDVAETDRVEPTYDLEVQPAGRPIENFLGGRGGVFLSNTAGLCDPGYQGQITLELSNLGSAPVALTPEMRISQLTFTELKNPADRPYGADRGSKYQGQEGPQASRIQSDREFGGDQ